MAPGGPFRAGTPDMQPAPHQLKEDVVSDELEYEEINSEEVDRVLAALEALAGTVQSETIRGLLETASNEIYYLVYEDDASAAA